METTGKKVRNILLRLKLKGHGIVNYDGGDQKWVFGNTELNHMKTIHNNVTYAKRNFYKNADGETTYKIKISSDCLKHSIFEKEIPFQSPNISHDETVLYSFIGSPACILRGYFHEFGKGNGAAFKRKSPFQLNDAEQILNSEGLTSMSQLETFSKSGRKRTDNTIDDKADNTFFKKETVGDIEYLTQGNIDLEQLQFISTDIIFDRLAFSDDKFKLFSRFLKTRMVKFNSELGYFRMKNSINAMPERGFIFSDDDILFLVKHLFKSILDLNIRRKSASAITDGFEYKLVYTPSEDTMYDEKGWVSVKNISDIDNMNFEPENFYVQHNEEEALQLRKDIEENSKKQDAQSSAKKQDIKDSIEEKKKKKGKKNLDAVEELQTAKN